VKRTALDLNALLRGVSWVRLVAAAFLGGVGPWVPAVFVPIVSGGILLAAFTLVVASSGALLAFGPPPRPLSVAWLLCLLDATLVTAAVAATGGARSILVFLYVLLVTAACVLLPRWGAVAIAGVSSVLYAGLVLARSVVPVLAFSAPADTTTALDVLAILVNSGTLLVVSIVAGGLAERFFLSQRELETQRRDLSDLRAFRDVIFHSVGTGLVALDREHRITAFNRAAETITSVSTAAALGARWLELFGPGLPLGEIEQAITTRPSVSTRHETELVRPDGARVPVRVTCSALAAGDGRRLGLVAACEDLSAIRALEARMRQADRLATLGRMAANIAHEIRNPLASLSGAVEALTLGGVPVEMRECLTQIVLRESDRLSEIIRNFLEYARPAPLVVERVDAVAVLDDVLHALAQRLPHDGVKIVREFPASLPLEADRQRLRQALWNLCVNALGAMPAGGELRVDGGLRSGMVELTVADSGEEILPQDLPHVFEPFFSTRHDGGGLGLALAHRIAQEHGGEVTVRSEHGVGAEFTLHLPARHA